MRRPLLLAAVLPLFLAGCEGSAPNLAIASATIAAGPKSAAIYARIDNRGGADRLIGIEIDGLAPVTLHVTSNDGGVMRMRSVDGLDVPANGRLELNSGGAHGMAMGRIIADGTNLPLAFRFERSGAVPVSARLTGPGGMEREQ